MKDKRGIHSDAPCFLYISVDFGYSLASLSFGLDLSQDAVHHPVGGGGTEAVAGAEATLLQVLHDVLDEGLLHVLGVGHGEHVVPSAVVELDGLIGENGETQHTLVANDLDAVFTRTLVSHEAP